MSNNESDIHMSNNDSLDEETKRILAEVEPDALSGSDDSKESKKDDKPKKDYAIKWEENTAESPDSEW